MVPNKARKISLYFEAKGSQITLWWKFKISYASVRSKISVSSFCQNAGTEMNAFSIGYKNALVQACSGFKMSKVQRERFWEIFHDVAVCELS